MSIIINQEHSLQDIHQERAFNPSRKRYAFASALLLPAVKGAKLLDVGGGTGEFTQFSRKLGYQTMLADGSYFNVERENQLGYAAIQLDLNYGLPTLEDKAFDGVVCLDVIEHIVPAEQLLREISRVLKPNGFLILSTPNFSYILDRLQYLMGGELRAEGYHYRFFTQRKLIQMLEEAGFVVESRNSIGSALGINFILRILSFGHLRIPNFRVPILFENWLASTFVFKVVCPDRGE